MKMNNRLALGTGLLIAALSSDLNGEQSTIPEILARAGTSVERQVGIGSGYPPSVSEILRDTDAILRGFVGEPKTYLAKDKKEVYTDYRIDRPTFLYYSQSKTSAPASSPGIQDVVVTLPGGTIEINGLRFTSLHKELPRLEPGAESVLLLKRVGDRYRIAGEYYGAFRIANSKLVPLTKKQGFATEYRDLSAFQAVENLVSQFRALDQK